MKKWMKMVLVMMALAVFALPTMTMAQDDAGDSGQVTMTEEATDDAGSPSSMNLWAIITGSGWLGVLLWMALLACSVAAAWLAIDFFITIKPKRIIPEQLVADVKQAMDEGDVMKAMERCEAEPGVLSSILLAGFRNVQEGFEVIEEQVGSAADLESEKLMQRVAYLNMCGSLAPMLGLLGTVQGMIMAFANLATSQAGAAQQSMLAMNISQALWTTAGGLVCAIPAVALYTYFKNRLSRIVLGMESMTIDLIKGLRHVEVVAE
ncbi:MAG: MotA/TolQ/ExbB proton channel family protein [Kiritimatiellae bacterium]|nr:MotA/TolQ/ExbB proton channel family protein [Kiritimatiellia bacterium]